MSPFANKLKEIRNKRNLQQKKVAELIGCEQSYISGLETDAKVPPQGAKLLGLLKNLKLSKQEENELMDAAQRSERIIKLPMKADEKLFEVFHELKKQASTIDQRKLQIISLILEL